MFVPQQKVVCIDDVFHQSLRKYFNAMPTKGETYTVRDIVPGIAPNGSEGEVAIYLEEIQGTINDHGIERGFNAERFAPLDPHDSIVEEFESMLAH